MNFAELLQSINNPPVIIGLFVAATLLVLIDFYFPVDWPAHIGYAAFAAGIFLVMQLPLSQSALAGIASFGILEVLHYLLFSRFLTNAPGTEGHGDTDGQIDVSG